MGALLALPRNETLESAATLVEEGVESVTADVSAVGGPESSTKMLGSSSSGIDSKPDRGLKG